MVSIVTTEGREATKSQNMRAKLMEITNDTIFHGYSTGTSNRKFFYLVNMFHNNGIAFSSVRIEVKTFRRPSCSNIMLPCSFTVERSCSLTTASSHEDKTL